MKPISVQPPHPVYAFQASVRDQQVFVRYTLTEREDNDADVTWWLAGIAPQDDERVKALSADLTKDEEKAIGALAVKDAGLDPIDINMIDG